jgi:nucleoside-diphosphate-sugar epimerase
MAVAIFGASGTIGRAVAAELLRRGHAVRAVGRSEAKLQDAFPSGEVECVPADVATPEGCARASAGTEAIVYALGLPYTAKAFEAYAPMMRLAISAARAASVGRLILVTNVYPYGRPKSPAVDETHPREPASIKGRHRKDQEDIVLAAHDPAGLQTLSLRLPDFYGPHADLSLGNRVLESALAGKPAQLLGPIDTPHEFVFTPDVAPVICDLLERPDLFGRPFNLAGPAPITMRDFAARAYRAAGAPFKVRAAAPWMVRALGLFSPLMRELAEMSYLQTTPVLLDDSALSSVLPLRKTPYEEGIRLTLDHLRGR